RRCARPGARSRAGRSASTCRSLRPVSRELPSFDLIVATVGRTEELVRFLDSLGEQDDIAIRVIVVDQNEDDRLAPVLAGRTLPIERVRSARGLSRARNAGLELVEADVVAFPDDDCTYPHGLLPALARRFADDPSLDGLSGRVEDETGDGSPSWEEAPATID